jgi:hypothetical protein
MCMSCCAHNNRYSTPHATAGQGSYLEAVRPAAVGASSHVAARHGEAAAKLKRAYDLPRAAVTHVHHRVQLQAETQNNGSSSSSNSSILDDV